ncbi:MAG TPA: GvpL/GvpF family gas vesicle protein [Gemmatimonadaceae bacterium]|nr:GvpL/GvpF family gas vesicle protein [Gemmatimonadaceae bacterium]
MATYLYCLLPVSHEPPPAALHGVDGGPVRAVNVGAMQLWVSDVERGALAPSIERARAHDQVVRCGLERGTPLPARFGQAFDSDAALVARVRSREAELRRTMERVQGMVEMTVRILSTGEAGATAAPLRQPGMSGREYLSRIAERERTWGAWVEIAERARACVSEAVRSLVEAEAFAGPTRRARVAAISHLVHRGNIAQYRGALSSVGLGGAAVMLTVSGPWAPYSFAEPLGV